MPPPPTVPADLHLHSLHSDGTFSPEELVRRAHEAGLSAIALTDHDTMDGCPAAAIAAAGIGIEFVPATELTAEINAAEIHLLAFGPDVRHPGLFSALTRFQAVRQERVAEMVRRINALGVPLELERVHHIARCKSPGRPHVARALVESGICSTVDEAFERFLKRDRPGWAPKFRIDAAEAIQLVHDAGGVAVLAHPGLTRIDPLIPDLVDAGLDGIECWHTRHSAPVAEYYQSVAARFGLLTTGGSDCHGFAKGEPLIGSVRVASRHLRALQQAIENRHGHLGSEASAEKRTIQS
jgi:predicted metal-dependent phosphoesterase TrpH